MTIGGDFGGDLGGDLGGSLGGDISTGGDLSAGVTPPGSPGSGWGEYGGTQSLPQSTPGSTSDQRTPGLFTNQLNACITPSDDDSVSFQQQAIPSTTSPPSTAPFTGQPGINSFSGHPDADLFTGQPNSTAPVDASSNGVLAAQANTAADQTWYSPLLTDAPTDQPLPEQTSAATLDLSGGIPGAPVDSSGNTVGGQPPNNADTPTPDAYAGFNPAVSAAPAPASTDPPLVNMWVDPTLDISDPRQPAMPIVMNDDVASFLISETQVIQQTLADAATNIRPGETLDDWYAAAFGPDRDLIGPAGPDAGAIGPEWEDLVIIGPDNPAQLTNDTALAPTTNAMAISDAIAQAVHPSPQTTAEIFVYFSFEGAMVLGGPYAAGAHVTGVEYQSLDQMGQFMQPLELLGPPATPGQIPGYR
jgi:hypothetical protein